MLGGPVQVKGLAVDEELATPVKSDADLTRAELLAPPLSLRRGKWLEEAMAETSFPDGKSALPGEESDRSIFGSILPNPDTAPVGFANGESVDVAADLSVP